MKHPSAHPLSPTECRILANALGDTPETVISVHLLERGFCRAYVAGRPGDPIAAIVQAVDLPTEPAGFGQDPAALWDLLRRIDGWTCVNVSATCAPALGSLIEAQIGTSVRLYGDVHHVLRQPVSPIHNAAVRRLTADDLPLLEAAPAEVRGGGFGSIRAMLDDGIIAGAVVQGNVVSIAHTSAVTERHADVGVATLAPWRGREFATAAASLVAREVQHGGRAPVWSAGEDNAASLHLARKLGFTEVGRRTYVIPHDRKH